jgi:co-chaperonin GroES (HSP10)
MMIMLNMTTNPTEKFIVIGDRIVLRPKSTSEKTKTGLYLPPGVQEKEKIQSGFIVKTGPGYAVAPPQEPDEVWKEMNKSPQYIPLQAKEGDLAIYLQSSSHEIEYEDIKYVIVPQSAILLIIRESDLREPF